MTDGGLFSQVVLRIAGGLLHFIWQGVALAFLSWILLTLIERRRARARYAVAVGFLAAMLAAPLLTVFFFDSADALLSQTLLLLGQPPVEKLRTEQWASWIAAIWLGGVTTGWIRLAVGWRISVQMIRESCAPDPELSALFGRVVQQTRSGAVRLLVSARAVSPVVIGWIRPVVLLPVTVLTGLSLEELRVVIAHELAHVRRHDYLVNILQRVVESLLFYHPAVWWLSARVRAEREHAADEAALEICDDPAVLARALLQLEETRSDRFAAVAAVGGSVADRVSRILHREPERSGWQSLTAVLSFMGLWVIAGLSPVTILQSETPHAVTSPIQASSTATLAPVEAPLGTGLRALAALAPAPPEERKELQQEQSAINGQVRAPRLFGQVSDTSGRPAASKLWVRAIPEVQTIPNIGSYIDETDTQGRYEMNIPPGRYVISVEDPKRVYRSWIVDALKRAIIVPADEDSVHLDLDFRTITRSTVDPVFPGPDYLVGRIEVDDGSPLPVGTLGQFRVVLSSASAVYSTQPFTNTQGIFMFPVIPGTYMVSVAQPMRFGYYVKSMTYGNMDLAKNPLTLQTDGSDTEIRIVLTRTRPADAPPGVKLSGRITDWNGRGAMALFMVLNPGDVFPVTAVTPRADGSFEIEGVPPGRYSIGTNPAQKSGLFFEVGQTDVTNLVMAIDDPRGARFPVPLTRSGKYIRGVVESGNGTIPRFEIRFIEVPASTSSSPAVSVSAREFSTILPEGIYRVSISGLPRGYSLRSVTSGPFDLTSPFLITYNGIADRFSGSSVSSAGEITIRLNAPSPGR